MAKTKRVTTNQSATTSQENGSGGQLVDPYPLTRRYLRRDRKSKYEDLWGPETREAVLVACSEGASMTEIAVNVLGITPPTLYAWLDSEGREELTETIRVGFFLAKAWWLEVGRSNLEVREFNTRLYEFQMRNRYAWAGMNSDESLPAGSRGGEEDESAGVRDAVDVGAIIEEAKRFAARPDAIDVEYTEVKATKKMPPARKKKARKKTKKMPPLPGKKRGKRSK